jgi:hypothetical protein
MVQSSLRDAYLFLPRVQAVNDLPKFNRRYATSGARAPPPPFPTACYWKVSNSRTSRFVLNQGFLKLAGHHLSRHATEPASQIVLLT